jgi:hypothetical protein|uniref:Uncharacterized protein n=1 Tax=Sipha flava TaxID=143950 RepID=A0A2S2QMQ9_9HEMI
MLQYVQLYNVVIYNVVTLDSIAIWDMITKTCYLLSTLFVILFNSSRNHFSKTSNHDFSFNMLIKRRGNNLDDIILILFFNELLSNLFSTFELEKEKSIVTEV